MSQRSVGGWQRHVEGNTGTRWKIRVFEEHFLLDAVLPAWRIELNVQAWAVWVLKCLCREASVEASDSKRIISVATVIWTFEPK